MTNTIIHDHDAGDEHPHIRTVSVNLNEFGSIIYGEKQPIRYEGVILNVDASMPDIHGANGSD